MLTNEQLESAKAAAMKCVDVELWDSKETPSTVMRRFHDLLAPALIVELIDRYNLLTLDYEDALDRLGQAQRLIEAMRKGRE